MSLHTYRNLILPLREQAATKNRWLRERLDSIIPDLMQRENMDMWLIICREYNEDPVIMTMLPAPAMAARRRTILAFCKNEEGTVERLSIDRYGHGDFYEGVWNPEEEDQWDCLARIVKERDPQKIAVNFSKTFAFGDGITYTEAEELNAALGDMMQRCVSAEKLAIGWLETRSKSEIAAYPTLVKVGHALIKEAFSSQVIHPGVTTTDDIVWWMRQKMDGMGLQAWFQPDFRYKHPGKVLNFYKKHRVN